MKQDLIFLCNKNDPAQGIGIAMRINNALDISGNISKILITGIVLSQGWTCQKESSCRDR